MNWDNLDWNNFSCVDMTRKIRDEMSAKYKTIDALYEYLLQVRKTNRQRNDRNIAAV